jgi:AhpD family alkylhydroperoxidase
MEQRMNIKELQPAAYKGMSELEKFLGTTDIAPLHKELIKIRASQLNNCAYCLNMHTKDARKLGETEQRIYLISAWREAYLFTEEERAILELTEEVTLLSQHGVSDGVYNRALALFGEIKTAQIIMNIVVINAWNRIAVSTRLKPE